MIREVPGQDRAGAFLARALRQPGHAYLFSGPEGSGKRLGMRAFAAGLLCPEGGCGACRACRLALGERHPNMLVLEPTGADILVGRDAGDPNTARWFVSWASRSAPEPGRKVMVVLQADRLRVEAADVLLKMLEEPPRDTVFVLLSARPDELPETVRSRVQELPFPPLAESFVVETLVREGVDEQLATLACRLSGGNVGRARRLTRDARGLASREVALEAARRAAEGPDGALAAAEELLGKARAFRADLAGELEAELEPFLDERGRPEDAFRGVVRRTQERHERHLRRAEREYLDLALLALAAYLRDLVVAASGGEDDLLVNMDRPGRLAGAAVGPGAVSAAVAFAAVEEARAHLADETNLNARLVLERLFLLISERAGGVAGGSPTGTAGRYN